MDNRGDRLGIYFFWSLAPNLALLGFSPAAGSWYLVFLLLESDVLARSVVLFSTSALCRRLDIADEHALATGKRQEGIFYSARTFLRRL